MRDSREASFEASCRRGAAASQPPTTALCKSLAHKTPQVCKFVPARVLWQRRKLTSQDILRRLAKQSIPERYTTLNIANLATRTADAVTISTDLGQRRLLVDTRTLERTYVDGDTIKMELVLTTARGDTVRITRYLVRSALPAAPAPAPAAPG